MKKTLYLVATGQGGGTVFTCAAKSRGWCDSPPDRAGTAQAGWPQEYFRSRGITFDHAYSSTSERACDTLEILTPMPYTRVKGLKEWNFGVFESESEDLNPPLPYGDFFKGFGGEGEMEVRAADVRHADGDHGAGRARVGSGRLPRRLQPAVHALLGRKIRKPS